MRALHPRFNYILLLTVVFGGFFIFGFSENIKGPAIPQMQTDFSLSEGQLGLLLSLNSLGYLLACSFTSALSRRIGIKWTGVAAFAVMAVSGVCMYVSFSYGTLAASYFLLYIGNGMLEIGLAIMASRIFVSRTGMMMNLAHFFYGLSSVLAPLAAASMMGWNMSGGGELGWRGLYLVMLSLSVLPALPALIGKFPAQQALPSEQVSFRKLLRDRAAWMIVVVLSCGVISELAVGAWLVNFLERAYGWGTQDASGMLSLFFLFFTLSRLFLGPLTDRVGLTLSVSVLALLSGVCSFVGLAVGESGAVLFALAGAGISPIYPTVMAIIAKRYPRGTDTAITFVVTLMGVASAAGNLAIGYVIELVREAVERSGGTHAELTGLQAGYGFIALMALLSSAFGFALYVTLQRKRELV